VIVQTQQQKKRSFSPILKYNSISTNHRNCYMFYYSLISIEMRDESLKIIPVIDILNAKVVHAVRGKRSEYKPLQSILTASVEPLTVARALKNLGFTDLYIADLDAIIECSTDFQVLKQTIEETGLKLIVDAGVTDLERAQKLLESGVTKLVIGTETLTSKAFVADAVKRFGSERVTVSLDLKGEEVLTKLLFIDSKKPLSLLSEFKDMGISNVIVLDLARVGSGEGVNVDFIREALALGSIEVYVGGGVRDLKDLVELKDLGVSGVLLATALHSGKIGVEALRQAKLL
jgi:phosphoribosylformimino-5-aminoimidazole carboxamide ribotide isomerase